MQGVAVWGTFLVLLSCSEPGSPESQRPPESWDLVAAVRIGSAAGADYPLQRVLGLLPADDGSILVRQARSQELPVFGGEGELVRVIGGRGEGPGEYLSIDAMGWLGDTLWVGDWRLRRVTYQSAEGGFWSDAGYDVASLGVGLTSTSPFHLSGDWAATHPAVRVAMMDQIGLPVLMTDRNGRVLDTLSVWDRSSLMTRVVRGDRETPIFRPFLGMARAASSPSGSYMAVLEPVVEPAGDTVKAVLKVWNAAGAQVLDRVLGRVSATVPEASKSEWLDEQASRLVQDPQEAAPFRSQLENTVRIPERFGFADALVVSDDGHIWIGLQLEAEGRVWWILNAEGRLLATTATPKGTELMAVGPTGVWGVMTDDLGINYIVRFDVINRG